MFELLEADTLFNFQKHAEKVLLILIFEPRLTFTCLLNAVVAPHFSAFGLNTERYGVSVRIQSKCPKMQTRITPNTDTFQVPVSWF